MEKRHKAEMISITLVAAEVGSSLAKYSNGGYNMDGLTIAEVLKNIVIWCVNIPNSKVALFGILLISLYVGQEKTVR